MGAEALGIRLLSEVKEESLGAFLGNLRLLHEPRPSSRVGIPQIDRLLEVFQYPVTQAQTFQSWGSPTRIEGDIQTASRNTARNKTAVIEIVGPSGCGKSHILYYAITIAILPSSFHVAEREIQLDGKDGTVIFLDADNRFNATRLYQIMMSYVTRLVLQILEPNVVQDADVSALVKSSMQHIHVFRPSSTSSLLATIESIPDYLLNVNTHVSGYRVLRLLLLDSATAFYWSDRFAVENARVDPSSAYNSHPNKWPMIVKCLQELQRKFDCTIIATSWALFPTTTSDQGVRSCKPCIPGPWASFCTLRLRVSRCSVPKFKPGIAIEEARHEARRRQQAVEKGQFEGYVDGWGSEEWSEGVHEGLKRVRGKGWFKFWVRDEEVGFDGE
ncbi:MAG: hypothetical protein M1834_001425 [Cirrosporium novae-zelandiae]|nr:MAG: hypothetical protein M1834_001425 [Cirrosporium novae-zelandiae]